MTNGDGWQTPGSDRPGGPWGPPTPAGGPQGGPFPTPPHRPPGASGQPGAPGQQPPGQQSPQSYWPAGQTPGPQQPRAGRPAVPLRPLGLGDVLGGAFGIFRRNVRVLIVYGLVLSGIATIVSLVLSHLVSANEVDRLGSATARDAATVLAGSYTLQLVASVITLVVGVVGRALLEAPVAAETGQQVLGRTASVGGVMALLGRRRLRVVWWALLVAAAIVVGGGVTIVVFAAIVGGADGIGGVLAGIGALFGLLLGFGVLAAWLATKFSLTVPGIVLEGLGVFAAAGNSWRLVRGAFWRTFGIELLVRVMFNVAVSIASIPLSLVLAFSSGVFDPLGGSAGSGTASGSGTTSGFGVVAIIVLVIGGALAVAVTAITDLITAGTTTLLYVDRRFRTEGLDGRVASYLDTGLPSDPFATVAPGDRRPNAWGSPAQPGGLGGQPGPWTPGGQPAPRWGQPSQPAPQWGQPSQPAPQWGQPSQPAPQWGQPGSGDQQAGPQNPPPGPGR